MAGGGPERTCVGCRGRAPKHELIRIVGSPEGVRADPSGHAAGRGAYVHPDPECVRRATGKGALSHALRAALAPEEVSNLLRAIDKIKGANKP